MFFGLVKLIFDIFRYVRESPYPFQSDIAVYSILWKGSLLISIQ
jgi:hypothetical protein